MLPTALPILQTPQARLPATPPTLPNEGGNPL
jgi:hypothetical protein